MSNPNNEDFYDYSDEFNYALWTEDTVATLTNVPWDAMYRDVVRFNTPADLDAYLDDMESSNVIIDDMTYAKPNYPVSLPISINEAMKYNYLRVVNTAIPEMSDTRRVYYYFVTNPEWESPGSTRLTLQLDVFQTFGHDVKFNNCYIERGHIGIANEAAFESFGRSYLTTPEGFDIGGEYRHIAKRTQSIMSGTAAWENNNEIDILVCSTVDLSVDPGTVRQPKLQSAPGDDLQGMPSGATFYVFKSVEDFQQFMEAYASYPWITQAIISVTAIPTIERYGYEYLDVNSFSPRVRMYRIRAAGGHGKYYNLFPSWRDEIQAKLPDRYRHLTKFLTSPYSMVELTTYTGTPIFLKPESWQHADAPVAEKAVLMPPSQRVTISPQKYNSLTASTVEKRNNLGWEDQYDDGGDYMDLFTVLANFPSFALVNNGAIGFLASNANSLAYQHGSADWSQQRALQANQTGYDQASAGIATGAEQGRISRNAAIASNQVVNDTAGLQALAGGGGSVVGGLMSGNPIGAAGGVAGAAQAGLGYVVNQNARNQQLGVANSAGVAQQSASLGNAGYNRDTNKDLADFSARGDYANAIAGINAKTRDAQLTQPSTSGQVGGEAFNMIHGTAVISMRAKLIGYNEICQIGEFWLRYGYAVRRFGKLPESLQVMTHFTYWKLTETYITGAIAEQFKQTLRGIFEKGVTVYNDPDDIGTLDMSVNRPLGGITL